MLECRVIIRVGASNKHKEGGHWVAGSNTSQDSSRKKLAAVGRGKELVCFSGALGGVRGNQNAGGIGHGSIAE